MPDETSCETGVDLYWLPLGAGGRSVRWNGRMYEAVVALREHRPANHIYHSALIVRQPQGRFVIEMAPVWNIDAPDRGVVLEGPVGAKVLGRFRMFRYEIRCWRDGYIPDAADAVDSPQCLSSNAVQAEDVLATVPDAPRLTWGRDDVGCGDMWNSNSLTAWLLARSGHDMSAIHPPAGGRAPGWQAGLALATRQLNPAGGQ